jgi:hypothetical protein
VVILKNFRDLKALLQKNSTCGDTVAQTDVVQAVASVVIQYVLLNHTTAHFTIYFFAKQPFFA